MTYHQFSQVCDQVRFRLDRRSQPNPETTAAAVNMISQVRMDGLRVTPSGTPPLYRAVERVAKSLHLDEIPEVYIVNEPRANAFVPTIGMEMRPFMVIHSGLVELLSSSELEFAMGHELGHLGMGHCETPQGGPASTEFEALQSRSRQRYAEVSADRIGLLAVKSVYAAAGVMIKLASGLRGDVLEIDTESFLAQLDDNPEQVNREWELYQSHPALPLRLWALLKFGASLEYAELTGVGINGIPLADVEEELIARFAEFGDVQLGELESSFLHRAMTWLGLLLVMDDERISPQEREELERLVGSRQANKAIEFAHSHGTEAVQKKVIEIVAELNANHTEIRSRFVDAFFSFAHVINVQPDNTLAWKLIEQPLADLLTPERRPV